MGVTAAHAEAGPANERRWLVATRVMLVVVAVILGVLTVSGIVLVFRYRPDVSTFAALGHVSGRSQARAVHRLASRALVPAFGGLAVAATRLAVVRRRAWRVVAVAVVGLGVVAAGVSGFLLPWDQLAMNHVTVGTNIEGYGRILFGHDLKYVLVGSTELAPRTVVWWFWFHVVVTSLVVVGSLAVVATHARDTRSAPGR